jgi:PAS domain S-box-containing protein
MENLTKLKLILFMIGLTVLLTLVVVYLWERNFMAPLYGYVGAAVPADGELRHQWRVAQRIEHFFISIIVDSIVVSLLLWMVNREQRKLRASDERYRALFEQASDGIGVVTVVDHRLVDANDRFAEILGYDPRSVIGSHVCELFMGNGNGSKMEWPLHPSGSVEDRHPPFEDSFHSAPREIAVKTASGKSLPVLASCSNLSTGKERLLILNIHDLSEHKQLEKERQEVRARLAQNERINALGRMAAQVAHEVKNPLAGLRLYSLHFKSKAAGKLDEKEMSIIDKIILGINHLSNTVEDVLSFARPIMLTRDRVDLNRIVTEAANLMEPQMTANRIEMRLDMAESPLWAMLDEASIRATLMNLMVNSVQAMSGGGRLVIATRDDGQALHVTVTDSGVGMTQEQVEHVFEPFYTTKSQGLGLGMSYAWKVIEQHKGTVLIESEVGKGTQVRIALPREE